MNPFLSVWEDVRSRSSPYPSDSLIDQHLNGSDPLSAIDDDDLQTFFENELAGKRTASNFPYTTIAEFLVSYSNNESNFVSDPSKHTDERFFKASCFFVGAKRYIQSYFARLVKSRFIVGGAPINGCFLAFTKNLRSAFLATYDLRHAQPEVHLISRISDPRGVLEIESVAALADPVARNLAKSFLTSGHKIVIQNGIVTHVDRRLDRSVFGPTIDTLFLSDILSKTSFPTNVVRALEIGSGSGHVISSIACNIQSVAQCASIDISASATNCTWRNLTANLRLKGKSLEKNYGVIGPFDAGLFREKFDLVVCNPPYISLPPEQIVIDETYYAEAVSGNKLICDVLTSIDNLLSDHGQLLMMVSSTSKTLLNEHLPKGLIIEPVYTDDGLPVPFDVEAVLTQSNWLNHLEESGAVICQNGVYEHYLRPVWVRRPK